MPDWAHIGYPIAECSADGSFVCTKPAGTGGLVTPAVVAEQMLYEIGDPAHYILPDVVCDFTQVVMAQAGPGRVRVAGARGKPPTPTYKVCATYMDGYKLSAQLTIIGHDARAKAERTGEAILTRTSEMLARLGLGPYTRSRVEVLGTESCFGPHSQALGAREVIMRLTVMHPRKEALDLLAREVAPAGTSWSPGTTGSGGGRSSPAPSIKQFGFLLDKARLAPMVSLDGMDTPFAPENRAYALVKYSQSATEIVAIQFANGTADAAGPITDEAIEVPLIRVAHARSGDKGDISNIGVIARHPGLLPLLRDQVTPAAVAAYLAHFVKGKVTRFDVPGIHAFNFVCEQALDGGGMASLRNDPLGKGMGQILLSMPVKVNAALLALCRN